MIRGRQRTADDHGVRVGGLDAVVGQAEQASVGLGIYGLVAPLRVDVGFVPDLVETNTPPVTSGDRRDVISIIVKVVRWGVSAVRIAGGAGPGGWIAQAGDDFQVVLFRQVYDVIVFVPGRAMREVPAVLEVAFPVDFEVFPGKFLPDPVETGVGDQLQRAGAFLRVHLLFQESVDPKGRQVRIGHRHVSVGVGQGAGPPESPLDQTPELGEGFLLARHREDPTTVLGVAERHAEQHGEQTQAHR